MILKDKRVSQGLTTKQIAKRLDVAEAYDLSIEEMLNWLEEMKNNKKEGVM